MRILPHYYFSQKELEILYQRRRGQVKTIVMDHFNSIIFRKSGPAYKQHTNHSLAILKGNKGKRKSNLKNGFNLALSTAKTSNIFNTLTFGKSTLKLKFLT